MQSNPEWADATRYLTDDSPPTHQKFEAAAAAGPSWEAGEQKGVEGAKEVNTSLFLCRLSCPSFVVSGG